MTTTKQQHGGRGYELARNSYELQIRTIFCQWGGGRGSSSRVGRVSLVPMVIDRKREQGEGVVIVVWGTRISEGARRRTAGRWSRCLDGLHVRIVVQILAEV